VKILDKIFKRKLFKKDDILNMLNISFIQSDEVLI